jgi:hypothetical protein
MVLAKTPGTTKLAKISPRKDSRDVKLCTAHYANRGFIQPAVSTSTVIPTASGKEV